MGAMAIEQVTNEGVLCAGVPARQAEALCDHERFIAERPARDDLPGGS